MNLIENNKLDLLINKSKEFKMKSLFALFQLVLVFVLVNTTTAQDPAPAVNVNCVVDLTSITANSFKFDVTIRRTGDNAFDYVKGQYCFSYNTAVRPNGNGGTWTLSILSSDLPPSKRCVINTFSTSTNGVFYLVAPSDNLEEFLVSNTKDTLVARVQASLSVNFEVQNLNLVWRTSGDNPFTKLYYNDHSTPTPQTVKISEGNLTYSMTNGTALLPVELSAFNISTQGRNVNLIWRTESESNSYIFEIERASSSTLSNCEWKKIGSIAAAGNSSSIKEYSYTDTKLNSGTYSYRLKMIDNDGTFEYSAVAETEINLPKEYALSQNYPNAFNPATRIDYQLPFDSKVTIELYSITGERAATIINEVMSAGYYNAVINTNELNLASGVYIYRMTAKNIEVPNSETVIMNKKLMLMK